MLSISNKKQQCTKCMMMNCKTATLYFSYFKFRQDNEKNTFSKLHIKTIVLVKSCKKVFTQKTFCQKPLTDMRGIIECNLVFHSESNRWVQPTLNTGPVVSTHHMPDDRKDISHNLVCKYFLHFIGVQMDVWIYDLT